IVRARGVARGDRTTPLSAVEAQSRYRWIREIVAGCIRRDEHPPASWTDRLDRILTHKIFGTLIFAAAMLVLFDSMLAGADPARHAIDALFRWTGGVVESLLPEGALRSLLV